MVIKSLISFCLLASCAHTTIIPLPDPLYSTIESIPIGSNTIIIDADQSDFNEILFLLRQEGFSINDYNEDQGYITTESLRFTNRIYIRIDLTFDNSNITGIVEIGYSKGGGGRWGPNIEWQRASRVSSDTDYRTQVFAQGAIHLMSISQDTMVFETK